MQLQNTLILLGLAATSAVAQANNYPECISDCIERRPTSSFCNGDETGDSLDFCTCQSFSGSLLIECMQACPEEDRAVFAGRAVPESCREALFPGVEVGDDDSSNNDDDDEATTAAGTATAGTATAGTATVTEDDAQETGDDDSSSNDDDDDDTATVTVTENSTASPTDDAASETGSDAASPTTGGDEPSQTGDDSADASESSDADEDDDSAAMGIQIPGLLAAGGLVAALML